LIWDAVGKAHIADCVRRQPDVRYIHG
jgi:hypothetical protein